MPELTLESLAKRVEELERKLAESQPIKKDWRDSVGMFTGSEFMQRVDAECAAMRETERQAAREGESSRRS